MPTLKEILDRKKKAMTESMQSGQVGSIDPNRNQKTGLTFTDVNNTYQIDKIYEDELGNKYCYKVVENDSTQQTSDTKFPTDVNIFKNENGEDVMLQKQYIKETDSPYDVRNESNEIPQFESIELEESSEIEDIIEALKESSDAEPIISDEDDEELKESAEILGNAGFDPEKYRERVTTPAPDAEQHNYGVNHVTIVTPEGTETSIYEADEYKELVEFVRESVSKEVFGKFSIGEPITFQNKE